MNEQMDERYADIQKIVKQSMRGARERERASIINWIEEYMLCNPIKYTDGGKVDHYRACDCTRCHPNDQGELFTKLIEYINRRDKEHDENSVD
jgi:hypothetical protein